MAQNSKHFIFVTIQRTRNADRVWQDGSSQLQDMWCFTEKILTAEAGRAEMVFTQSSGPSLTLHLVSLTNKVAWTSYISVQDSKRKEVFFCFTYFSLKLFLLLLCQTKKKKLQTTQNPDLHFWSIVQNSKYCIDLV